MKMKKQLIVVVTCLSLAAAWAANGPKLNLVTGEDVELSVFREGAQLFSNRPYRAPKLPSLLDGQSLVVAPIEGFQVDCLSDGRLYALAPEVPYRKDTKVGEALVKQGFERVADVPVFQLFGTKPWERVVTYRKDVRAGEHFDVAKWAVFLGAGAVERSDAPLPPYLANPPARIDVDGGRQLFVDDYVIESKSGVVRHWNRPVKLESPILRPTREDGTRIGGCAVATDGGLWWDPTIGKYRLWYEDNWAGNMRYAESKDGMRWEFPDLGKVKGTNRVFADGEEKCNHDLDSWSVWPNYTAANPYADWTIFTSAPGRLTPDTLYGSSDGRSFTRIGVAGWSFDRSTLHFDSLLGKWVYSLRDGRPGVGRARRFLAVDKLKKENAQYWFENDPERQSKRPAGTVEPELWTNVDGEGNHQLYNFDAVPYESLMLGVREVLQVNISPDGKKRDNGYCWTVGLPKTTDLQFAFSRDGRHYTRAPQEAIKSSGWGSGKWDTGYLSAMGGICVIKDERLWFYYSALRGDAEMRGEKIGNVPMQKQGMYYNGAIGAATLRRDGFCGMVADGNGEIVTRPLAFTGSHLFVNAECLYGEVKAEIIDGTGQVVPGFSVADCKELKYVDRTKAELVFGDSASGARVLPKGDGLRIRFMLHCATLYSFWVSPSAHGESRGYVAAGGPAYNGLKDI